MTKLFIGAILCCVLLNAQASPKWVTPEDYCLGEWDDDAVIPPWFNTLPDEKYRQCWEDEGDMICIPRMGEVMEHGQESGVTITR